MPNTEQIFYPGDIVRVINNSRGQSNILLGTEFIYGQHISQSGGLWWNDDQFELVRSRILLDISFISVTGRYICTQTDGHLFWRDTLLNLTPEELDHERIFNSNFPDHMERVRDTIQTPQLSRSEWYAPIPLSLVGRGIEQVFIEEIQNIPYLWPVGTIIKWKFELGGVKDYLLSHKRRLDILLKIIKLSSSDDNLIAMVQWEGEAEIDNVSINTSFFTKASSEESEKFEASIAKLRLCTERPLPGTVVLYKGKNTDLANRKGIVLFHRRDDLKIRWLNDSGTTYVNFKLTSVYKNQEKGYLFVPENHHTCSKCSGIIKYPDRLAVRIDSKVKFYCDNYCAEDDGLKKCQDCERWLPALTLITLGGRTHCDNCHIEHYRPCVECENIFHVGYMRIATRGQACESCRQHIASFLHSYSYKPSYICTKMAWENTRYLGFELEVETDSESNQYKLAEMLRTYLKQITKAGGKPLHKLIYTKYDGSLKHGIEVVTHPFTLQAIHKHLPSKDIIDFLKTNGALIKDSCGMHVHVSKEKITKESLLNGKWFFYKCAKFIKLFSERTEYKYCMFEDYAPRKDPYNQEFGRRTAFNVAASEKTMELRLFKATLDYTKFMANLHFADCFAGYIQYESRLAFLKNNNTEKIWANFLNYANSQGQYKTMLKYIGNRRELCV